MEARKFSVYEAVMYGFKSVVDNIRLFFLLSLVIGVIIVTLTYGAAMLNMRAVSEIARVMQATKECTTTACVILVKSMLLPLIKQNACPFLLTLLGLFLIFAGFYAGYQKVMLEFYDRGSSSVKHVFSGFKYIHKIAPALLIFILMIVFGLAAFVVPGIYLGIRFVFFSYFIVDKNAGIIEAFKRSWESTRGQGWHIFSLALVQGALVGMSSGFVLIVWPMMALAYVYAYRKLAVA